MSLFLFSNKSYPDSLIFRYCVDTKINDNNNINRFNNNNNLALAVKKQYAHSLMLHQSTRGARVQIEVELSKEYT